MGDFDKSIDHNLKSVTLKPGLGMAHNNLAVSFFYKGDNEKARLHARHAVDLGYHVHPDFLKSIE